MPDDESTFTKRALADIKAATKAEDDGNKHLLEAIFHELQADSHKSKGDTLAAQANAAAPGSNQAKDLHNSAAAEYGAAAQEYKSADDEYTKAAASYTAAASDRWKASNEYFDAGLKNLKADPPETAEADRFFAKSTVEARESDSDNLKAKNDADQAIAAIDHAIGAAKSATDESMAGK
jgi:hypothetical protein